MPENKTAQIEGGRAPIRKIRLFRRFLFRIRLCRYFDFQYVQKNLGAGIKLDIVSVRNNHRPRTIGIGPRAEAQAFESKNSLGHANTYWLAIGRNRQQSAGAVSVR